MDPSRLGTKLFTVRTLARGGIAKPARPDRLVRAVRRCARWGKTPAAGYGVSAARYPDEPAIIDERGTLTFAELDRRTNALAPAWKADGIGPGRSIAVLAATTAASSSRRWRRRKLGADTLYLNTDFSGPQLAEVCREERPCIVHDADARRAVDALEAPPCRCTASPQTTMPATRWPGPRTPPAPAGPRIVILGHDRDAEGTERRPPAPARCPLGAAGHDPAPRAGPDADRRPVFHSWGLAHFNLGARAVLGARPAPPLRSRQRSCDGDRRAPASRCSSSCR